MVVLRCSHSAAGRARLRWHRPLGTGTRSGPASREITGWCVRVDVSESVRTKRWRGAEGCLASPCAPCCQPRERLLAASPFHLGPVEINGGCPLCKHVFQFQSFTILQSEDLCIWPACTSKHFSSS